MADVVAYEVVDGVAVLTVQNPPVNALSTAVRRGIVEGLARAEGDEEIGALVIIGDGRTFPAGADISEFGKPPADPWLPEVCNRIELCPKPVVAALHGTALGGGFEVALAAHYRLAATSARIGLPEVTLGILPGAGGTQRTPRIVGAEVALDLMLSGKPMPVTAKAAQPFFDKLIDGDLRTEAIAFARDLIESGAPTRPTREMTEGFSDGAAYQDAIAARRKAIAGRPEIAPAEIVRCVEAAALLPFETGLDFERAAFETCVTSDQSAALRHAFFAERRAAKFPELADGRPREIEHVGVIGGGTMGAGIVAACLDAGLRVSLVERDNSALKAGLERITAIEDRALERGRVDADTHAARLGRLNGAADMVSLAECDVVIEAVIEDMDVKKQIFSQLDAVVKEGAVMATNTSYLDVNEIATATDAPEDVLGLHFFSPANIMRLLEVVVADKTSPDTVATGVALAKRLGKIPVRSAVSDGFIGNRVLSAYRNAAELMLMDGATPYELDDAMRAFGMALGPYQVMDLAGLDIGWARRKRLAPSRDPSQRYLELGDRLCEAGHFGQKTGRGYYRYKEGSRKGTPDPEVLALLESERREKGVAPRSFTVAEIQRRCLCAMVNEGAKILREGVASRPSDIDTVMLHGYGFPRWRGGPMKAADLVGLLQIRSDLRRFAEKDTWLWEPDPLFDELIRKGEDFESLNG
ncbi:short chain enoyl-CoA hydratase /3-hydroxyacyl-CoA dehydrogenase [Salinihabitans flavidus]|uniref:Short chain enoyl-CoA hydratase /3-hydroxyacyl-CoA dehydrogenase n=1 Tax=Salinihabitans flavidus TaxID=569882 RepID=A0A1H8ME66_9RHOB|nr:3-hydroxyacyl-CoA dehydrogenase NAD-binding domain-containing protein [Salinihabitans flavidus]SEO15655.1 short chain enoyl-CoA hydratase /3-hydroxyacyl-CoA dehydrogenase [Salinihabitans flavidus]